MENDIEIIEYKHSDFDYENFAKSKTNKKFRYVASVYDGNNGLHEYKSDWYDCGSFLLCDMVRIGSYLKNNYDKFNIEYKRGE